MARAAAAAKIERDHALVALPEGESRLAFRTLQFTFVALPVIAGLDKFANVLVDWSLYLSPFLWETFGGQLMLVVGAVEIVAGLVVAFAPRFGGYLVAAWLWAIVVNLFSFPGGVHGDIILRDLCLSAAAVALAQLALVQKGERRAP
ncbi:MAG: hypothetical protein ACREQY_08560 [Candidatus Binatia bacterium]